MCRRSCPACDYDLRGNAMDDQCPECGFACSAADTCLRPSARWQGCHTCRMVILLVMYVCYLIDVLVNGFSIWPPLGCVILGTMLLWPSSFLYRRYVKYRYAHEFFLLGKSGIRWRLSGHPEFSRTWAEIEAVSPSRFLDTVMLCLRGRPRLVYTHWRLRPRSMRFDEFSVLIERHWWKYGNPNGKSGS